MPRSLLQWHAWCAAVLQYKVEKVLTASTVVHIGVPERATSNIIPLGRKMSRKMSDTLRLRLSAAELSRAMSRPASGLSGVILHPYMYPQPLQALIMRASTCCGCRKRFCIRQATGDLCPYRTPAQNGSETCQTSRSYWLPCALLFCGSSYVVLRVIVRCLMGFCVCAGLLDDMLDIHGESAGSNADLCATFA